MLILTTDRIENTEHVILTTRRLAELASDPERTRVTAGMQELASKLKPYIAAIPRDGWTPFHVALELIRLDYASMTLTNEDVNFLVSSLAEYPWSDISTDEMRFAWAHRFYAIAELKGYFAFVPRSGEAVNVGVSRAQIELHSLVCDARRRDYGAALEATNLMHFASRDRAHVDYQTLVTVRPGFLVTTDGAEATVVFYDYVIPFGRTGTGPEAMAFKAVNPRRYMEAVALLPGNNRGTDEDLKGSFRRDDARPPHVVSSDAMLSRATHRAPGAPRGVDGPFVPETLTHPLLDSADTAEEVDAALAAAEGCDYCGPVPDARDSDSDLIAAIQAADPALNPRRKAADEEKRSVRHLVGIGRLPHAFIEEHAQGMAPRAPRLGVRGVLAGPPSGDPGLLDRAERHPASAVSAKHPAERRSVTELRNKLSEALDIIGKMSAAERSGQANTDHREGYNRLRSWALTFLHGVPASSFPGPMPLDEGAPVTFEALAVCIRQLLGLFPVQASPDYVGLMAESPGVLGDALRHPGPPPMAPADPTALQLLRVDITVSIRDLAGVGIDALYAKASAEAVGAYNALLARAWALFPEPGPQRALLPEVIAAVPGLAPPNRAEVLERSRRLLAVLPGDPPASGQDPLESPRAKGSEEPYDLVNDGLLQACLAGPEAIRVFALDDFAVAFLDRLDDLGRLVRRGRLPWATVFACVEAYNHFRRAVFQTTGGGITLGDLGPVELPVVDTIGKAEVLVDLKVRIAEILNRLRLSRTKRAQDPKPEALQTLSSSAGAAPNLIDALRGGFVGYHLFSARSAAEGLLGTIDAVLHFGQGNEQPYPTERLLHTIEAYNTLLAAAVAACGPGVPYTRWPDRMATVLRSEMPAELARDHYRALAAALRTILSLLATPRRAPRT